MAPNRKSKQMSIIDRLIDAGRRADAGERIRGHDESTVRDAWCEAWSSRMWGIDSETYFFVVRPITKQLIADRKTVSNQVLTRDEMVLMATVGISDLDDFRDGTL